MSTRGSILLAIGMLVLGLLIGGLTGGVAGFFMGRGGRTIVSQRLPGFVPPSGQQPQPNQPQGQQPFGNRGVFPPAGTVLGGARIEELDQSGPAQKAGLQVGDIITAVGSTKLDATHSLADVVGQRKPGEKVDFSVMRGTQTLTINVELGASPQDSTKAWLGIRFSTIPDGRFRSPNG